MQRGKSAGATPSTTSADEIRNICKRISPYIVHCWREVCEELGVADADIEKLGHAQSSGSRLSDVAFKGLCCWQEMVGKSANRDTLLRVLQLCGLRRAEDELRSLNKGRQVPFMGRPATAVPLQDGGTNRQARQKALANRLSRPKKATAENQQQAATQKKPTTVAVPPGSNPLTLQISPSKESDICEVKIRINVRGVRRTDEGEMESTKDDFHSTKDDFKHTCHTFLNLVMKHQQAHFKALKELMGFSGISVLRLSKTGFNINLFILCFNLGAFEVLYQSYSSGRLKKIVQGVLVTEEYLKKLNTKHLELSVLIEEGMVNKYRDILVVRSENSAPADIHPVDLIAVPDSDENQKQTNGSGSPPISPNEFNLKYWRQELYADIEVLQERYNTFIEKSSELLIILRIAKPPGSHVLENMQEVVGIFQKLRSSKSVSTESRIDFIEEYLTIVNQIRLKTEYINKHDLQISFDETLTAEACDQFHSEFTALADMLEPDFRFKVEERFIANSLSANEKITYGGMFSHIPRLLHKLHALCDILSHTVDLSHESSDKDDVTTDEPEVTVDENANITDKHDKSIQDTQGKNAEQVPE